MDFKRFLSVIVALAMMVTLLIPAAVSSEETDAVPEAAEVVDLSNDASEESEEPEITQDNNVEEPADKTPVDEAPKDETPADEVPADETPVDEIPADETPADETPADETPADETTADETPADETPADETPADETPVDEIPADETPADETPADETPADETPADETPVDETPADETPVDETPVDETPADEIPVDEVPAEVQNEEAVFENGYIRVSAGTAVYQDTNKNNKIGAFDDSSVVYAVMAVEAEDMQNSWLRISFDTDALRETGDPFVTGYVQMKSVTVLSAEEAESIFDVMASGGEAREIDGYLLPTASFTFEEAVESSSEEEVYEEVEVLEDEPVETDASISITAQPVDVMVEAGETATFTVAATGSGLTYQWQYRLRETAAWRSTTLNGCKTAELSFVAQATYNNRQYRCVVTDANGNTLASEPATLTIGAPVVFAITAQPKDMTVLEGETATFTVAATGSGLTYQWQYRLRETAAWRSTTLNGCKTAELSFAAQATYNNRQYRCVVTDANGNTLESEPATLTIGSPVVFAITAQPKNVAVYEGETATFTVAAIGDGLTYQWQVKISATASWKSTTLNGCKTAELSFVTQETYNKRQYRCVVTDANGNKLYSDPATLTIGAPVVFEITSQPKNVTVPAGETATFTVEAIGDGLTYQWQVKTSTTASWKSTTLNGCKTSELSFAAQTTYNNRQYRCVVTDANGNKLYSDPATLKIRASVVFEITAQPVDVTVSAGETATFTVAATGSGLTYQWQVKTSATASWKSTTLNGCKTSELSFAAAESYNNRQYRCVVTDANGNKLYSDPATLKIRASVVFEITVQPVDVTVTAGETATFTVAAIGDDLTYQWQVKTSPTASWKSTTLNGCKTAELSFAAQTTYNNRQYRCVITDANGNKLYSDPATLTVNTPVVFEITTQPKDVTVSEGEIATFTVVAIGSGLAYQWQEKTSATASWKNTTLAGYNTAELSFAALAAYNNRQYRCVVTDANGNTLESTPAILTVFWTKTVDGVIYEQIDADTCKVVGYTGTAASLTIPTTVDGKEVKEIGEEAFMGNTTLTSICLPNTITVIRARAFKNCTNLSSMTTH